MIYSECLKACIRYARTELYPVHVEIYKKYPAPSVDVWARMVGEVSPSLRNSANKFYYPLACMGRYEIRLAKLGIITVANFRAGLLAYQALAEGIPLVLLQAAARQIHRVICGPLPRCQLR